MTAETASAEPADIVRHGCRLCLAREPSRQESAVLVNLFTRALERFTADPAAAAEFGGGRESEDQSASAGQDAAWTVVANALLNLDEFFQKR